MRQLFVDIETDGIGTFRPPTQRILQLVCEIRDGDSITHHVWYSNAVKCLGKSHPSPHLLKPAMEKGIDPIDILSQFESVIKEGDSFIAHNAVFDFGIILHECSMFHEHPYIQVLVKKMKTMSILCTMERSTKYCQLPQKNRFGNQYKYPKLQELANKFDIVFDVDSAHNAIYDVEMLVACYNVGQKRGLWK